MKKRLMSAMLAIAMIVSVFSVIMVSPVSAVAATTYADDRVALRNAIRQLYLKGPSMDVETIAFLTSVGIFDAVELDATPLAGEIIFDRAEFVKVIGEDALLNYFISNPATFLTAVDADVDFSANKANWTSATAAAGTEADMVAEINKNLKDAVLYAASVYYFGQEEDDAAFDASFNSSRNSVVKGATAVINNILTGLKEQIGANGAKPDEYAVDFMGDTYKNFLNAAYKYHPALGINPFYNIGTAENIWKNFYSDSFYTGLSTANMAAVKWYTFEEIRNNEAWLPLMSAFDLALRGLQTKDGASELFYDYWKTTKPAFTGAFDALCKAIINGTFSSDVKLDMSDAINTFFRLQGAVEVYEKYVKDLYNNIYTSAGDIELLTNVLTAKRFIEYVATSSVNLIALSKANLEVLLKDILDGMANVSVLNYQQISAADIASGKALVKEANALISSFGPWTAGSAVDIAWVALKAATADLENMLPISAGAAVKALVPAEKFSMNDIYGTTYKNKAFTVEFYPNYFALLIYKANLESKINTFYAEVAKLNTFSSSNTNGLGALAAIINKYDYLLGIVGNVAEGAGNVKTVFNSNSVIYTYYLYETLFDTSYNEDSTIDTSDEVIAATKAAFALAFPTAPTQLDWLHWAYENCFITDFDSWGMFTDGTVKTASSGILELVIGQTWADFDYGFGSQSYYAALYNTSLFSAQFINVVDGLFDKTLLPAEFDTNDDYTDWEAEDVVLTNAYDNAVASLKGLLSSLTADMTVKIQVLRYVYDVVVDHFGITGNPAVVADGVDYTALANYPNAYFSKFANAANALYEALDINDNLDANNNARYTTVNSVRIAENNFYTAVKRLLTNLGDERFDAFLAQVNDITKINYGSAELDYQELYLKLENSVDLEEYLPSDALIPYDYYAFTLKSVAALTEKSNKYSFQLGIDGSGAAGTERLRLNFYNPLNTAINAFGTNDIYAEHAKDVAKEAAELKKMGKILYDAIVFGTPNSVNTDMPVWYAEELLAKLQAMPAKLAANHITVIAARKAVVGGLNDIIDAAGALSVYNYYVGENDVADGLWKTFDAAYKAAVAAKYDKLVPLAEIDAKALALADAMKALESIKREGKENDPTMEALTAKIAAAEKLAKVYDLAEYLPELDALNTQIVAAQKFVAYYGNVANISDLAAQIKALDDAMAALSELLFVYADLVAEVDAIAATVVEADYTADSYAAFKAAVDAAKALGEDATVSECKAALEAVKTAKNALVKQVVVVPDVSAVYEEAVAIYEAAVAEYAELEALEESYSEETMAALKNAIDALKAGIDADATDTQLIDLIVAVRLARSNLVVGNPKTSD